ncbi:Phospho-N-acetylmuramoyl-pentapeptide-transferase [Sulfurimonas denitrificans DSM 1251]|uniref:Phospho-N-acetylmuramoyl-pentapeptide-transferase n=1 Tax=Sulfurimonas denitrificans (strain ATCC 33889 / DSM 1251) TaxID=326298 RepID=MRAY_SULDN|nr:phospho-N-acetylmuramoyl-pentapeptide-transferase [Sulfurimonas denitrificans]Q30Q39.1 RecName: Full=Phospho-N-acetylmuramoyl-pentapeptide-transferase; AltName: Full=UDP-MurNAc-pentapeptide phosphotransferase [Sulfurimonas denitrificans DSM 1251]ABB44892.1 Phospho-N-acetylmuramoyl-pentapeptide-transferase [Sulfurimonas denitrificans DSM 1251]MDD3442689.1 phospho-N-acetylmuramoyl-pentapeptide-transferase [Sulfurimonas denitrificans]
MLYWLSEILHINILGYITIRAGIAFFLALFFTLFLMPRFIRWAQSTSSHQPINEWAPQRHQGKAKTPTMGGIVFIFATILASLISIKFSNLYAVGAVLTLIFFSIIGFKDDIAKIKKNENLAGLKAKTKLILQTTFALIISIFLYTLSDFNTSLYVPFLKNPLFDMGIFAIFFWVIVIIATSNAVNLTDGLDGLATVPSITALASFSIIIYITGNVTMSSYLLMPNINIGEVAIVSSALIGALSGFLWYNCHPAEVFMGDSGSLTIGAFLGYLAIISKSEILLLLIGSIFVIETLSVILQVGSYKLRKKRVFLMAPIHHHFEMKNWAENKIIVRFWIIATLSNVIALITLKIR